MILHHAVDRTTLGQVAADRTPALAAVGALHHVGREITVLVVVEGGEDRIGVVQGSLEPVDVGHLGDLAGLLDLPPVLAAVLGDLDQPVVGAGVDQPLHQRRLAQRDDVAVERGRGVLGHGVHTPDLAHHLERVAVQATAQVGTDGNPAGAAIVAAKQALRREVESRRRVRADDQRRIPVVTKRVLAGCRLGLDVHQLTALAVVACEAPVLVLRIDDVRVTRLDDGLEAVAEDRDVEIGVADAVHAGRARRSTERGVVLRTAIDVVEREIVVGRRLVELRDREVGLELPGRATIPGFVEAPVTAVEHMVRVRGVDPHRVTVHMLVRFRDLAPALAAVLGDVQPGVHGVDAIDIVRIGNQFVVVLRAGADVVAAFLPACAGVGGTVDASLVGLSLDDRVQDVGVRRREGQADAAHLHLGQSAGQFGPGRSRIDGLVDPRAGSAVDQRPDATTTLVARGVEHVGVARVEKHLVDPGMFVDL